MKFNNPVQESLYNSIIKPAFEKRKMSVQGKVMEMNGDRAKIYWREPGSGAEMQSEDVPMPKIGGGLFSEDVQPGDYVMIEFRNGNYRHPFVAAVHGAEGMDPQVAENGTDIPDSAGME